MNKKGVSIMIGYVLLVTAAIVMGAIIYNWVITYVPSEGKSCPSDVSVFIKEYTCDSDWFNITLKNNGKFNIGGYFIYASNESGREIANIDLSPYLFIGGERAGSAIFFVSSETNSFGPAEETDSSFDMSGSGIGTIKFVEIIPSRFQEIDNKLEFTSCGESKIRETLTCT